MFDKIDWNYQQMYHQKIRFKIMYKYITEYFNLFI